MYTKISATLLILLLTTVLAAWGGQPGRAAKPEVTDTIEVPTTGQIMDVRYYPEYGQWWIKCREGSNITVYTFDDRSKKWGSMIFVPKKPSPSEKKSDAARQEKAKEGRGAETKTGKSQPEKDGSVPDETAEQAKPESPKKEMKREGPGAKKWLNPFEVIKKGTEMFKKTPGEQK